MSEGGRRRGRGTESRRVGVLDPDPRRRNGERPRFRRFCPRHLQRKRRNLFHVLKDGNRNQRGVMKDQKWKKRRQTPTAATAGSKKLTSSFSHHHHRAALPSKRNNAKRRFYLHSCTLSTKKHATHKSKKQNTQRRALEGGALFSLSLSLSLSLSIMKKNSDEKTLNVS